MNMSRIDVADSMPSFKGIRVLLDNFISHLYK
ncbi:rCG43451 [Rattus norvegicus]|uniref:RCG43451 n=1 Tax=Rattus norvegicus TaxID=10116 RepID=A6JJ68_RAT|nr:rCG43451 [Rattus norvegicus]